MNTRFWGIVLFVAATATGWLAWHNREQPAADVLDTRPDYVLYDFQIVSLDQDGQEVMTLRAPHLARHPDDESVDIQTPVFLIPDSQGQQWKLAAAAGWVSADGEELRLTGGVEGKSPPDAALPPTTFLSDTLTVFPGQHLATTPDAVHIAQPGFQQQGVGFELDTAQRTLRLLSQVRTRYEPSAAR